MAMIHNGVERSAEWMLANDPVFKAGYTYGCDTWKARADHLEREFMSAWERGEELERALEPLCDATDRLLGMNGRVVPDYYVKQANRTGREAVKSARAALSKQELLRAEEAGVPHGDSQ